MIATIKPTYDTTGPLFAFYDIQRTSDEEVPFLSLTVGNTVVFNYAQQNHGDGPEPGFKFAWNLADGM